MKFHILFCFVIVLSFSSIAPVRSQWLDASGVGDTSAYCFAMSGQNLFVGTGNGVIVSTDSGQNWRSAGLTDTLVAALTVSGPNLFAQFTFNYFGNYSNGYFMRSSDNGASWTFDSNLMRINAQSLVANGKNLFAGTVDSSVYRSMDNGATWQRTANIGLTDSGGILAVSGSNLFVLTTDSGVYRSTDNGANWARVGLDGNAYGGFTISAIGNDLFTTLTDSYGHFFRSTDNGSTWSIPDSTIGVILSLAMDGTNLVAVTNPSYSLGIDSGIILISTDSGRSWTRFGADITGGFGNTTSALAAFGTHLFVGTDYGIFRSVDNGKHWASVNIGLQSASVTDFTSLGTNLFSAAGNYYTYTIGIFRSTNNGKIWTSAKVGLSGYPPKYQALAVNGTNLFTGDYEPFGGGGGGVFRSTDSGASWMASGLQGNYPYGRSISAIATNGSKIFAGTDSGVFISIDNGANWTSAGLIDSGTVNCFAFIDSKIFAGVQGSQNGVGAYSSTDNGTTWNRANSGLQYLGDIPLLSVYRFAQIGTNLFAATDSGVYIATDEGAHWTNAGLAPFYVSELAVSGSHLFAVSGGLFVSSDNGRHWDTVSGLTESLNDTIVNISALAVIDTNLFIGRDYSYNNGSSNSYGIWRRPLSELISTMAVTQVATPKPDLRSYPNPLTTSSTITFSAPSSAYAEVSIVNFLGVQVARLCSGEIEAGEHSFTWDATKMTAPRGMYECLVRINGAVVQRIGMIVE